MKITDEFYCGYCKSIEITSPITIKAYKECERIRQRRLKIFDESSDEYSQLSEELDKAYTIFSLLLDDDNTAKYAV